MESIMVLSASTARSEYLPRPQIRGSHATSRRICVAMDETIGSYATDALYLFRTKPSFDFDQKFVLGVLNSQLFQFLHEMAAQGEQRVIPQVKAAKLYDLPFPSPNALNPADVARHDRMVALVTQMLDLHARLAAEGVPHDAKGRPRSSGGPR